MNQRQPVPAPGQPGLPGAGQNITAPMLAPQGVPAHLMGLMANPALAAAAAVFPPAAMLSNPGAFLSMPEAFANGNTVQVTQVAAPGGMVLPRLDAAAMGNFAAATMDNNALNHHQVQQQQHRQGVSPVPAANTAVANMALAAMPQHNSQLQVAQHDPQQHLLQQQQLQIIPPNAADGSKDKNRRPDLSPEERAKQNRDRNREHARSTRLRKKAYVQKLKELVEGLHAERTEEVRQRRVAIQHLAEMQNVRRGVVRTFLRFHSGFETDFRKWETILEDNFWLKQPVTPYRSFRRTEIEQDCRISRGVQGMVADAASVSVMVEGIGSRSTRWLQIKREEFFFLEESKRGPSRMPRSIQDNRLNAAVSSLSSSSGSSNGSASDRADKQRKQGSYAGKDKEGSASMLGGKQVSSSSGSESRQKQLELASKDFHDYHAQPLPDPKLGDSGSSSPSEDSPEESNTGEGNGKRVCTDSSSGDDSAAAIAAPRAMKRRKTDSGSDAQDASKNGGDPNSISSNGLPPNIAKTGGITANIMGVSRQDATNTNTRLNLAPAIPLPLFAGIGKRVMPGQVAGNAPAGGTVSNVSIVRSGGDNMMNPSASASLGGAAMVTADMETSSSNSSQLPQIRACYHINEDDMILMEDVLMCPFIFRSQEAVVCGALAECVTPGMFRAHFSARNKLLSVEMVYDAMGFMQQLERASGSERTAQIIPGSLEMALSPTSTEARVITLAEPPFLIVNVNELWTRLTKYTQMEVEGRELRTLLEGEKTLPEACDRPGKPRHKFEDVAKGLCASSTNVHYDKDGREFVDFVCSYPLTNANDEITHLLHISKELPTLPDSVTEH